MSIKVKNLCDGSERVYGVRTEADGKTPAHELVTFGKDTKPGFVMRLGSEVHGEPDYEIKIGLMSAIWIYTVLRGVIERAPAYIASAAAFTDESLAVPGVSDEERSWIRTSAAIKMLQDLQPGITENQAANMILMEALAPRAMVESRKAEPSTDHENADDDQDDDSEE